MYINIIPQQERVSFGWEGHSLLRQGRCYSRQGRHGGRIRGWLITVCLHSGCRKCCCPLKLQDPLSVIQLLHRTLPLNDSTAFPNKTTSWGPSVQLCGPMWYILYSNHSVDRVVSSSSETPRKMAGTAALIPKGRGPSLAQICCKESHLNSWDDGRHRDLFCVHYAYKHGCILMFQPGRHKSQTERVCCFTVTTLVVAGYQSCSLRTYCW